jgi:hypothetical protein
MSQNLIRTSSNLKMLEFAVDKLGTLSDEFIFLGGCTTALFITDLGVPDVRATDDVDCIVDVLTLGQYYQIEDALRQMGFCKSLNDDVICRWRYDDLILDVMPTKEDILGFSNQWYKHAAQHKIRYCLSNQSTINLIPAPYFLATKLEAFKNRGQNDYFASHDLEDVITVIDGRIELTDEVDSADVLLREYLSDMFLKLLDDPKFQDALPGHLNYGSMARDRLPIIVERLKRLANCFSSDS